MDPTLSNLLQTADASSPLLEWVKAVDGILAALLAVILGYFTARRLHRKQEALERRWENLQATNQRLQQARDDQEARELVRLDASLDRWLAQKQTLYLEFLQVARNARSVMARRRELQTAARLLEENPRPDDGDQQEVWTMKMGLALLDASRALQDVFRADPAAFEADVRSLSEAADEQLAQVETRTEELLAAFSLLAPHEVGGAALMLYHAWRFDEGAYGAASESYVEKAREDLGVPSTTTAKLEADRKTRGHIDVIDKSLDVLRTAVKRP